MEENTTFKWSMISIGSILMVIISFTLLFNLLIPDPCYYHSHQMDPLLNLFYSASPSSNGHPEPNVVNFILSIFIGGKIGFEIYKRNTTANTA